ncbi:cyclic pyranopterin monophosphate synthase MoaC [Aeromicrobium duanguangcaii]|uniref:Cyclic pyranopterin monophosphate synthase MoaC n=1 Tax=Aeromicrobium duanguangcaii TaxID=2968086 RepID=A0ABY5KGL6_9ACTN|nr:cyclic pyranopterin monophosphate synthase MoaC [Aeromicrobium duanguangcaii]MCL3837485.1 cyclic pyranopterin monophosphate synthase MoaC [Aeromicrobium duanguangcaii]UUI67508.1 cyclic pyranopterin monophosphate synthase MoaC [Aeromicrobium duanguangcaii]
MSEGTGDSGLSHYRADGSAHMVDVSGKATTKRQATASGRLRTRADVVARIMAGDLPKGEALATARIAGILAAKQTPFLVPMCHPLPLSAITIDFRALDDAVHIEATVATTAPTGVEMEALTAVSIAALTLFDMVKAVDATAVIESVRVESKSGGTHDWERDD